MKNIFKIEKGQSMVLVALMLSVIMGCAALAIDSGRVHFVQIDLQTAADVAALAGAGKLPTQVNAISTARDFAVRNGADADKIEVTTPYNGDSSLIEVVCRKTVPFTFGKAIGFSNHEVTARSVAKKNASVWAGEALPFMNLDDNYSLNTNLEVWESTGPGNFESIWKDEREYYAYPAPHFNIKYEDGIAVQKGVDASIKSEILAIYEYCRESDSSVYIFSLRDDVIASNKYAEKNYLKNKTVVPLEDLVLLEVSFDSYSFAGGNSASIYLTVLDVYDFNNGEIPETASYSAYGGNASLVD